MLSLSVVLKIWQQFRKTNQIYNIVNFTILDFSFQTFLIPLHLTFVIATGENKFINFKVLKSQAKLTGNVIYRSQSCYGPWNFNLTKSLAVMWIIWASTRKQSSNLVNFPRKWEWALTRTWSITKANTVQDKNSIFAQKSD